MLRIGFPWCAREVLAAASPCSRWCSCPEVCQRPSVRPSVSVSISLRLLRLRFVMVDAVLFGAHSPKCSVFTVDRVVWR